MLGYVVLRYVVRCCSILHYISISALFRLVIYRTILYCTVCCNGILCCTAITQSAQTMPYDLLTLPKHLPVLRYTILQKVLYLILHSLVRCVLSTYRGSPSQELALSLMKAFVPGGCGPALEQAHPPDEDEVGVGS